MLIINFSYIIRSDNKKQGRTYLLARFAVGRWKLHTIYSSIVDLLMELRQLVLIGLALPNNPRVNFLQHSSLGKNSNQKKALMTVWMALTRNLWIQRNNTIFRGGVNQA